MNSRKKHYRFTVSVLAIILPLMILVLLNQGLAAATVNVNNQVSDPALPSAIGIISDDFNACTLNMGLWTFVNPLNDSSYAMVNTFTDDAALEIMVPGGNDKHSISQSNQNAPRMMQSVDDGSSNFALEAKFDSSLGARYQVQGILIQGEPDEFIRFEFFSDGSYVHVFAATLNSSGQNNRNNITITIPGPDESYYLRVNRDGDNWTQSYRLDSTNWNSFNSFSYALNVSAAGPYAGNSGDPPTSTVPAHTALVDYFFNTASPIDPEDGDRNALTLNVNPAGAGSASKNPNKSTYACNELVTINASPNEGWDFTNWSGDWSGSTNPDTVTMTGDRQITANFSKKSYNLTVNTVGMGSVDKQPNQASYLYNEVVTLTANADPGWIFSSWSGDLTGNDNPETITMNSDKGVTATFVQDQYTISSTVEGEGSVSWEPVKATYIYGEVITITATPEYAWAFTGWSGDLSGNENPKVVTIEDDLMVTAIFGQYKIMLPAINQNP